MSVGFSGPPPIFSVMFVVVPLFIVGVLIFIVVKGLSIWVSNNAADVVNTQARIVSKRIEVSGGSGDTSSSTTYYVTFEFADRRRIELQVRGSVHGLLVEGDQGTLNYQGTRFNDFQRDQ
ncbi:DUF2500 domain-containing protein [Paenibacillus sp. UNC451MF]|uniref:DUF2500 domain-containing protein n=1 Tax=Paenibacillus sp. UNC451MF TaxID=1449063 RepID=UPI0004901DB0|nr:DUF2500 domain-containing protein [Paenibacillus sp. UNC451MF]